MSDDEQVNDRELELDEDTVEDLDAESDDVLGGGNGGRYTNGCN